MENDGDQGGFPDEASRIRFSNELGHLRNNAKTKLEFRKASFGTDIGRRTGRWANHHATQMVDALEVNTSVTVLDMDLQFCSVSAIPLFLDFIQTTPRLEELVVAYSYFPTYFYDNGETRDQYDDQMSYIFRAVLQNPSIKKFSAKGAFGFKPSSQRALFILLSSTTTLTFLHCAYQGPISKEAAFAMAGGLARNSSIVKAELSAGAGPIEIAISGIGFASPIESLSIYHPMAPSSDFYLSISKVLHITPSLKTLKVGDEDDDVEVHTDTPIIDQVFWDLRQSVCSGLEKLVLMHVCFGIPNATLSIENRNRNVQILDLRYAYFRNRDAVRVLWSLVGLKKLLVCCPIYEEEEEERLNGDGEGPDCWGELIRMNKNLLEVEVRDPHPWEHCAMGIVQGACKHESLQTLRLDLDFDGDDVIVNERISRTLSEAFRKSTSLENFHFPEMRINAENMSVLVSGLKPSKSMKSIDFRRCNFDHEAWECLERALLQDGPNKMSISSIKLGASAGGERIVKPFLRSLPHMPSVKEAEICTRLDEDENQLLLQAAKDKKTLMSFETADRSEDEVHSPVENEIDFYLKLNRFGRQILDHTNVRASLWPILLCRTASERKNADALYFFLGEYFANYSSGGNEQPPSPLPQQQQHPEQSPRPRKFARLE